MTAQIADCINETLAPDGVGVVVEAVHHCMTTRGVHVHGVSMVTTTLLGAFKSNTETRAEFMTVIGNNGVRGVS